MGPDADPADPRRRPGPATAGDVGGVTYGKAAMLEAPQGFAWDDPDFVVERFNGPGREYDLSKPGAGDAEAAGPAEPHAP